MPMSKIKQKHTKVVKALQTHATGLPKHYDSTKC